MEDKNWIETKRAAKQAQDAAERMSAEREQHRREIRSALAREWPSYWRLLIRESRRLADLYNSGVGPPYVKVWTSMFGQASEVELR